MHIAFVIQFVALGEYCNCGDLVTLGVSRHLDGLVIGLIGEGIW